MGVVSGIIAGTGAVDSLGRAAQGIAQVFHPNASEGARMDHEAQKAALGQLGDEFARERTGRFDRFVDGLNRLPRPALALGTLGLFIYAMIEPVGFGHRMEGLAYVPDPLWWLLGAIVGFYFGARELHYVRRPRTVAPPQPAPVHSAWKAEEEPGGNPALSDWEETRD